ncbi:MAG: hypothetical protein Q9157_005326 [Trypethelium eluteriae]
MSRLAILFWGGVMDATKARCILGEFPSKITKVHTACSKCLESIPLKESLRELKLDTPDTRYISRADLNRMLGNAVDTEKFKRNSRTGRDHKSGGTKELKVAEDEHRLLMRVLDLHDMLLEALVVEVIEHEEGREHIDWYGVIEDSN